MCSSDLCISEKLVELEKVQRRATESGGKAIVWQRDTKNSVTLQSGKKKTGYDQGLQNLQGDE